MKAYITMFNELLRLMQACMDAGHSLRLVWVPGHAAVPQLSTVDRLAKVASRRHTLRSALGEECAGFLPISFLVARRLIAAACFAQDPLWRRMQERGMASDVSWSRSAAAYAQLYQTLLKA